MQVQITDFVIPQNRSVLVLVFFAILALIGLSINFFISGNIFLKLALSFTIVILICSALYFLYRVISNKPIIVINRDGLYNFTFVFESGFIPWHQIERIVFYKRFIYDGVTTRDWYRIGIIPKAAFIAGLGRGRRLLMSLFKGTGDYPIRIEMQNYSNNEIIAVVNELDKHYKVDKLAVLPPRQIG